MYPSPGTLCLVPFTWYPLPCTLYLVLYLTSYSLPRASTLYPQLESLPRALVHDLNPVLCTPYASRNFKSKVLACWIWHLVRSSTFVSLYSVSSSPFREALDLVLPCARQQLSPCTYYHCAPCFLYPVPPTLYLPPLIFCPRPPAFYLLLSTTYPPPLPLTSHLLPPTSPISYFLSHAHTHSSLTRFALSLAR